MGDQVAGDLTTLFSLDSSNKFISIQAGFLHFLEDVYFLNY